MLLNVVVLLLVGIAAAPICWGFRPVVAAAEDGDFSEVEERMFPSSPHTVQRTAHNVHSAISNFAHMTTFLEPEAKMSTTQLIRHHGYPAEEHHVVTDDGYIITIHRIPHGRERSPPRNGRRRRPVVFLQHGLACTSANWVINLPVQSLAFILADLGFDVWIGNLRGGKYGKKHRDKNFWKNPAFWHFSMDEHIMYDLPATLHYVLRMTRQNGLQVVVHSMGGNVVMGMLATNHHFDNKIKMVHALAPTVFLDGTRSLAVQLLAKLNPPLFVPYSDKVLGGEAFPSNLFGRLMGRTVGNNFLGQQLILKVIEVVAGGDGSQINATRLPVIMSQYPAGTSYQNLDHFLQIFTKKTFATYNYPNPVPGRALRPQIYDMGKVAVPVKLYYGLDDLLATPEDIARIANTLPAAYMRGYIQVGGESYSHADFLFGTNTMKDLKCLIDDLLATAGLPEMPVKPARPAVRSGGIRPRSHRKSAAGVRV